MNDWWVILIIIVIAVPVGVLVRRSIVHPIHPTKSPPPTERDVRAVNAYAEGVERLHQAEKAYWHWQWSAAKWAGIITGISFGVVFLIMLATGSCSR
jgi:hypothetical protein